MVIYATDFGATANDNIDDTRAINAALEAAHQQYLDNPSGGQVKVVLPEGTLIVSGTDDKSDGAIRLLTGTWLEGAGIGRTILQVADGSQTSITGVVRTPFDEVTTNASLTNLTIDGNRDQTAGKVDGFYTGVRPGSTRQDADILVSSVEIMDCSGYGFDPHEQTVRLTIENSIAHGNGLDGFVADYLVDSVYRNNISYDNDRHGFNVTTSTNNLLLVDNQAYGNGSAGLVVQRGSEDIDWPSNIQIVGGEYHSNAREGILIKLADDVSVDGAAIYNNMLQGVRIEGSSGTIISNNQIYNNAQAADNTYDEVQIRARFDSTTGLTYYSTSTQVMGNTIYSDGAINARYGIREESSNLDGGPTGTTVSGNTISGMDSGDVSVPNYSPEPEPEPAPSTEFPAIGAGVTQAEGLELVNFTVIALSSADAGGAIESREKGVEATATGTFTGEAGTYELTLAYYDENDGSSPLGIRVNGVTVDSWVADQQLGSSGAVAATLVTRVVTVQLDHLDTIEIFGSRDAGELLRVDSLSIAPVSDPEPDQDDPVVATDDFYDATENAVLTVAAAQGVLGNDTAADGGKSAVAEEIETEMHGSVLLNDDGSFVYTPPADFFGTDRFTYTASDADGDTDTASVTLTVHEEPEPPTGEFPAIALGTTQLEELALAEFTLVNLSSAEGGVAVESRTKGVEASASGTFTGDSGTYNLTLAYYDENDGASPMGIRVNGVVVDSWIADEQLGSSGATAATRMTRETTVSLNPNDTIEIFGTRDGAELLRIDYLAIEDALLIG